SECVMAQDIPDVRVSTHPGRFRVFWSGQFSAVIEGAEEELSR
ncbi:hypothetical protein ABIB54_003629, partial [Frigoribacterium sp. UYMn621]